MADSQNKFQKLLDHLKQEGESLQKHSAWSKQQEYQNRNEDGPNRLYGIKTASDKLSYNIETRMMALKCYVWSVLL